MSSGAGSRHPSSSDSSSVPRRGSAAGMPIDIDWQRDRDMRDREGPRGVMAPGLPVRPDSGPSSWSAGNRMDRSGRADGPSRDIDIDWMRERESRGRGRGPPGRDRSRSPRGDRWQGRGRGGRGGPDNHARRSSPGLHSRSPSPPSTYPRSNRGGRNFAPPRERDSGWGRAQDRDRSRSPSGSFSARAPLRRDPMPRTLEGSARDRSPDYRPQGAIEPDVGPPAGPSGFSQGPPTGPAAGIPTGPRGGGGNFGRGGFRGRGGMRGGMLPAGPSHLARGGGHQGGPSNFRGRGGGLSIRGRGRGGSFSHSGGLGADDPPPKSLNRKVDAGGNAVHADIMMLSGSSADGPRNIEDEEMEEGEQREEGEMVDQPSSDVSHPHPSTMETQPKHGPAVEQTQAASAAAGVAQEASTFSTERRQSLHLGSLPARQSFAPNQPASVSSQSGYPPHFSSHGATDFNGKSPITPVAPPGSAQVISHNPYSSTAWQMSQSQSQTLSQAPPGPPPSGPTKPTSRQPTAYLASHFPSSAQPDWEAEMWTLSSHRLASLVAVPTSFNFYSSLVPGNSASGPGATPGTTSSAPLPTPTPTSSDPATSTNPTSTSTSTALRQSLLDLRDAQFELELTTARREEAERVRVVA